MRGLKKNKSGMLLLDLATSLIIIWFLIWIFGGIINQLDNNTRETALRYQLYNFRTVLWLYKELKGHYPKDLEELVGADYKVTGESKSVLGGNFLLNLKPDLAGAVVDAFGNSFYYESKKGVIWSQSKGYENW
jgi:hypothetical protein